MKTLFIPFLVLFCLSCKKDTNDLNNSQPIQQSSAWNVTADINGISTHSDTAWAHMTFGFTPTDTIRFFAIHAYCQQGRIEPSFNDTINSTLLQPRIYNNIQNGASLYYTDAISSVAYNPDAAYFEITHVDTTLKLISGKFNGIVHSSASPSTQISITNGIFTNVHYRIY